MYIHSLALEVSMFGLPFAPKTNVTVYKVNTNPFKNEAGEQKIRAWLGIKKRELSAKTQIATFHPGNFSVVSRIYREFALRKVE